MTQKKLKDICDKGSSNLKQKDVEALSGEYPVFGASGLINNIPFYQQETDYIAIVKDGSGIGRVVFLPAKSSVIGTMQYILPKKGYNIKYIAYCLQSLDLSKYKQGAAIPHIYFRDYGERVVNVTESEQEQERIVAYLDTQFAKIDAMKANAVKALAEAKALFQSALTEAMSPKEGWKEKTLGELCTFSQGIQVDIKNQFESMAPNRIRFIRIIDVTRHGENPRYIDVPDKKYFLNKDEIAMVRYGTIGHVVYGYEGVIANNLFKISINDKGEMFNVFLYYLLRSQVFQKYIHSSNRGVAMPAISFKELKPYIISLPPLPEQQRIVTRLDALSAKVAALEANYTQTVAECAALKQALLREVFE